MKTGYQEITLEKSGSTYQRVASSGDIWAGEDDLLAEIRGIYEIFELGVDKLPNGMDDIRGMIQDEPSRIFGYFAGDIAGYFGISAIT